MKLVSYLKDEQDQLALQVNGFLYNMDEIHPNLPGNMGMFLNYWDDFFPLAAAAETAIKEKKFLQNRGVALNNVPLLPPVPFPVALRFGQAFQQHTKAILQNQGHTTNTMADGDPVLTWGNQHSAKGAGEIACMPDQLQQLDYELQAAVVICRPGRNIAAETAEHYIGGLMILNRFSARVFHENDIKGNDFATVMGPALVTLDELESFAIPPKEGHIGKTWNLPMECYVNDTLLSAGNLGDMDWTFSEIVERSSYGITLYPGDIISSGTVATGSLQEINGSARRVNPAAAEQWLHVGDNITLVIDQLGKQVSTIAAEESSWSILK